jgi:hypothetical protein
LPWLSDFLELNVRRFDVQVYASEKSEDYFRCARQALYRKSRLNRHDKTAGETVVFGKSRDL